MIYFKSDEPVKFEDTVIHPKLIDVLRHEMHIETLFDMQHQTHSFVRYTSSVGRADDIILCAPTGSGKTLAYALPIVHELHDRVVPGLRAIIVVPTRDLALQVAFVFTMLAKPFGLSVTAVTGASSFAEEESNLASCEILVATPGRLVDHVLRAKYISLEKVVYLVLDESDRLLQESYDYWLQTIMPKLGKPSKRMDYGYGRKTVSKFSDGEDDEHKIDFVFSDDDDDENEDALWRPHVGMLSLALVPTIASRVRSAYGTASDESVRRILVSATQDLNPTHMAHLDIRNPMMIRPISVRSGEDVSSLSIKYNVPISLLESGFIVQTPLQKPAALLALLGWTNALPQSQLQRLGKYSERPSAKLVFTNSVDSAHRLTRMLEFCAYSCEIPSVVFEMSGELSTERRQYVIDYVKGRLGKCKGESENAKDAVIVCSDVLSRGMDILTVDCVINYDKPAHIRTYLHRAGRTARAGRPGSVATLLLQRQVHHFRGMIHEADRGERSVKTFNMNPKEFFTAEVKDLLSTALSCLKRILNRERLNFLQKGRELPAYALFELYQHGFAGSDPDQEHIQIDEDTIEQELHGKIHLDRKRTLDDDEAGNDDGSEETDKSNDANNPGDDKLEDLLYAQIAQNLMEDFT